MSTGFFASRFLRYAEDFLKIISPRPGRKRFFKSFFYPINALFQAAFRQFILIQTQIMTKFVQKSCLHFPAKNLFLFARQIPKIFQEQNDLRRHGNLTFIGKFRSGEQTQCIRFNPVRLQPGVRNTFKRHRQLPGLRAQRFRQRLQGSFNFPGRHRA